MTKFIVVVPNTTLEQQRAVNQLFSPARAAWWHWSQEVWLLSFSNETPTVESLRDELKQALSGATFLVFDLAPGTRWAGWGPLDWQNWFNQFWK
jgi:hypothetical protein